VAYLASAPDRCWTLQGDEVRQDDLAELENPGCTVVAFPDKELIFHQFDAVRDMTSEQLAENVEVKVFQDAGLNPMLEYKTSFTKRISRQDERSWTIGAVAVSTGALEEVTASLRTHVNYIDAVVPTSSLPYALYNAGLLEPKRDVFIYFQKDTLLVSIFSDGEYVYGKSQDHGVKKLMESYAQLSHARMEYEDFVAMLTSASASEDKEQNLRALADLREAISNALFGVKNVLLYAARIAGITNMDRVFIGTSEGVVPGLEDLAQELLEVEGHDFNFHTPFYSQSDQYVDQTAILTLLEADNIVNGLKANPFNCTINSRPGAFLSRPGGQGVALVSASLAVAIIWPLYHFAWAGWYDFKIQADMIELRQSEAKFNQLEADKKRLEQEVADLGLKRDERQAKLNESKNMLDKIRDMRRAKTAATGLANLFERLKEFSVRIESIDMTGRDTTVQIRTGRDTQITQLLRQLVESDYTPSLHKIVKSEESGAFTAELKVRLPE
jgi:Tfp pilus assembly protein PilN